MCYAVELAEYILNVKGVEKLGWENPAQFALGETWDVSRAHQFKFWQKVSYTNPGVTFPKDKHHPGRWLGISHDVGDLLACKVEKDAERWERHIVLDRSAVHADDGSDLRLKEVRKPDDTTPRSGILWELTVNSENLKEQEEVDADDAPLSNVVRMPAAEQEDVYGSIVDKTPE